MFGASLTLAASLVVEGTSRMAWLTGLAMLIGGLAWATALTCIGVSAFAALPEWVRARGMSLYLIVLAGGLALGSAAWGALAEWNLTGAHLAAAAMLVVGLTTTRRWKLGSIAGLDLRIVPSDEPNVTSVPHPTD
jgi:hypothetical protein